MNADFQPIFEELKALMARQSKQLVVKADSPVEYTLVTRKPSQFPQHKGQPMWFGSIRLGKAYVSYHLMPLYMNDSLKKTISPALAKRMQGKTCFNFKTAPEPAIAKELQSLTALCYLEWKEKDWA